jgi:hypothetical protein
VRIIGGKDYYDGAGQGVDRETIFLRSPGRIEPFPDPLPENASGKILRDRRTYDAVLAYRLLIVGGEAWPHAVMTAHDPMRPRFEPDIVEMVVEADRALQIEKTMVLGRFSYLGRERPGEVDAFFRSPRDSWMSWAIDNRAGVALVRILELQDRSPELLAMMPGRPHEWRRMKRGQAVAEINGIGLGERHIPRLIDPATLHMRIAGFMSGVLPRSRETVEISDATRIAKAGFDAASFRDWKGKKKPRRRRAADVREDCDPSP